MSLNVKLEHWNAILRERRQQEFLHRQRMNVRLPIIVAEGDSWFHFPNYALRDVVENLRDRYLVWTTSAAGGTLRDMILQAEYIPALRSFHPVPRVLIFSGGGDDILPRIPYVLPDFAPGRDADWYVQSDLFTSNLAEIERDYRTLFRSVDGAFGGHVKVVTHGYDYAIPWMGSDDFRNPPTLWMNPPDQFVASRFRQLGILDHALQRAIVRGMIDRFNALLAGLCGTTEFPNAYHVDLRGTLSEHEWRDEIHPTDRGFQKVAFRIENRIESLI